MRIEENEGGGETVVVERGDDLESVPESHAGMLTPGIREVFSADPVVWFRRLAAACRFPAMAAWMRAVADEGVWELNLNRGYCGELAGFDWQPSLCRGALVTPSQNAELDLPADLQHYYWLVDVVDTNGYGCAGGFCGVDNLHWFDSYNVVDDPPDFDMVETLEWGCSPCGDVAVMSLANRGGWYLHEEERIVSIGTIADTINWVFQRLLEGKGPYPD